MTGLAGPLAAQDPTGEPPLPIHRLEAPLVLDGVVDEPEWERVEPLPLTMFTPTFGGEPTERTEVRIAYDDTHLWVSGRMFDSDPAQIRTNTFYRDLYSGDDLLAVVIDSYDDYETAVWFVVNPGGARNDRTVSNDAVFGGGGMPMNSDWNAHWDVATTQDDAGWYAEMRIPFSTLGFQAVDDAVVMGLISYRFVARKNERQLFPAIDPRFGGLAFAKPSQARRIVLEGVRAGTPLYVTPYTLGGVRQVPELEGPVGDQVWETDGSTTWEAGVDLRYSPTSNVALDFTVNTDFAQVEADDQQINLTRFPLFFPEKRQFFQERASTFQFTTGGFTNRLFHSRRIGLEDGEIVRIWGGARAVGRLGGMDYGVLTMETDDPLGGTQNVGVARVSQQVLNPYSSVGAMVTSRLGSVGRDNVAYGVDALVRVVGDEYATLKWAQTFDERLDEASPGAAGLLLARWERQLDEGLSYQAEYIRVGEDYRPGLGFQTRTDFDFLSGSAQYKRFLAPESALRSASLQVGTQHYWRRDDGSPESRQIQPVVSLEYKDGTEIRLTGRSSFESVERAFDVAGAPIPAGEYWFHDGEARLQLPRNGLFRGDYTVTAGGFYDGTRVGVTLNPTWNQSRYLELAGTYEVNRLDFSERGPATTTHLARLKAQVALNTHVFFSAFAQYDNVSELTTLNARFRYHVREGTDLWVVYNEGLHVERDLLDRPRLPLSAGRTLLVKYNHALIW